MNKISPVWVSLFVFVHHHPAWGSHLPSQGTAANQGWPVRCRSLARWVVVFGLIFLIFNAGKDISHKHPAQSTAPSCCVQARNVGCNNPCSKGFKREEKSMEMKKSPVPPRFAGGDLVQMCVNSRTCLTLV